MNFQFKKFRSSHKSHSLHKTTKKNQRYFFQRKQKTWTLKYIGKIKFLQVKHRCIDTKTGMFQKDFLMMRVTVKRRNWKCKWGILLYKSYLFCGLPQRYTEVKSRSDWDIKKGLLAGIFHPTRNRLSSSSQTLLGHTGGSRYGSAKIFEQRSHIHGRKFCETGAMVHWPGRSILLHTTKAS